MEIRSLKHDDILRLLPERLPETHKSDYGRILLICGCKGYTGAAALAAMGALRVGAGLVFLGVPECIYGIEATKLLEPVIMPLPDDGAMLSCDAISLFESKIPQMDAILIGPGLGVSEDTRKIVLWFVANYSGTLIIDADGINVLKGHINVLRERPFPTILTPHEGEFRRLIGDDFTDRTEAAVKVAADLSCILMLKGHRTVITDGNTVYINQTGNPGMAVGGSGDVAAGMITGLVGQGIAPLEATAAAAWIHGAAGDICAEKMGMCSMLPSDMLEEISQLLK